jgi:hypothetical protein
VHPFGEQVALIDEAVRNVKAVRASNPFRPEEEDTSDTNAFHNFRSCAAPPGLVTYITLKDGSRYAQVPSKYASVHNTVSVYRQAIKFDDVNCGNEISRGDTRYGSTGGAPPGSSHKYAKQVEHPSPPRENARSRRKDRRAGERLAALAVKENDLDVTSGQELSQNPCGTLIQIGGSSPYSYAEQMAIEMQLTEQRKLRSQPRVTQQDESLSRSAIQSRTGTTPQPGQQSGGNQQSFGAAGRNFRQPSSDTQHNTRTMFQHNDHGRQNQPGVSGIHGHHVGHNFAGVDRIDRRPNTKTPSGSYGRATLFPSGNSAGFEGRHNNSGQSSRDRSLHRNARAIDHLHGPTGQPTMYSLVASWRETASVQDLLAHGQVTSNQEG